VLNFTGCHLSYVESAPRSVHTRQTLQRHSPESNPAGTSALVTSTSARSPPGGQIPSRRRCIGRAAAIIIMAYDYAAFKACAISAVRSDGCSMPIDNRIVESRIPILWRMSAGTPECVMLAGRGLGTAQAHHELEYLQRVEEFECGGLAADDVE
jgi:hypothetical protein